MLKTHSLVLAMAVCTVPFSAFADGADSSSGGELIAHQDNPWFIGQRPFKVCVEKSENYSQDLAAAKNEIKEALLDWTSALTAARPATTKKPLPDGEKKTLTLTYEFQESCDKTTELKILLGKMTQEVRDTLKANTFGYVSYAKRTSYNQQTGRAKGTVWIIPDLGEDSYQKKNQAFWNFGKYTYHVVHHELGHVFGFNHALSRVAPSMLAEIPQSMVEDGLLPRDKSIMTRQLKGNVISSQGINTAKLVIEGGTICKSIASAADDVPERRIFLDKLFERVLKDDDQFCLVSVERQDFPISSPHVELRNVAGKPLKVFPPGWNGIGTSDLGIRGIYPVAGENHPYSMTHFLKFWNGRYHSMENGYPAFLTPLLGNIQITYVDVDQFIEFSFYPESYKKSPFGD